MHSMHVEGERSVVVPLTRTHAHTIVSSILLPEKQNIEQSVRRQVALL